MRKLILLLFLVIETVVCVAKDSPGKIVVKVLPTDISLLNCAKDNKFEDDNIQMSFSLSYGNFKFQLKNKTPNRIYIEWENSRVDNEKPIFGEDNKITAKQKKEDEAVSGESSSIERSLFKENPLAAFSSSWAIPAYANGLLSLKKLGGSSVSLLIPIRFMDNTTKDYKLMVNISYINTADVSTIKVGMKSKDVKKEIGNPDDKKDVGDDIEEWIYQHNVKITISKKVVTNIEKLNK